MLGKFMDKSVGMPFGLPSVPMAAMPALLGGVAASIGAILSEATALVTGFSAAGAGALAFYLLAKPAFSGISSALKQLHTDQAAYNRALTTALKFPELCPISGDSIL
jgi:hypothetical protein